MQGPVIRPLTVLLIGLSLLLIAFLMLDVELTKQTVGLFIVLPIGALFAAFGLWSVTSRFIDDE